MRRNFLLINQYRTAPENSVKRLQTVADNLAVQIFGKKPKFATRDMVPIDLMEGELAKVMGEVGESLSSKPENVQMQIIEGKLMKFLGEDVLECQDLGFEESDMKVGDWLKKQSKNLGISGGINVIDWYSF